MPASLTMVTQANTIPGTEGGLVTCDVLTPAPQQDPSLHIAVHAERISSVIRSSAPNIQ